MAFIGFQCDAQYEVVDNNWEVWDEDKQVFNGQYGSCIWKMEL